MGITTETYFTDKGVISGYNCVIDIVNEKVQIYGGSKIVGFYLRKDRFVVDYGASHYGEIPIKEHTGQSVILLNGPDFLQDFKDCYASNPDFLGISEEDRATLIANVTSFYTNKMGKKQEEATSQLFKKSPAIFEQKSSDIAGPPGGASLPGATATTHAAVTPPNKAAFFGSSNRPLPAGRGININNAYIRVDGDIIINDVNVRDKQDGKGINYNPKSGPVG